MKVQVGSLLIAGLLFDGVALEAGPVRAAPTVSADGSISGVVVNSATKSPIPNALVLLQCSCLPGTRESQTNTNGLYAFRNLPHGTYTVQVLTGQADASKVTTLPRGAKFRANFSVNPDNEFKRMIRVGAAMASMSGIEVSRPRPTPPKQRLAEHRESVVAARETAYAAEDAVVETETSPLVALDQPAADKPLPKDYARQVVYSGTMSVSVFQIDTSKESVETLVTEAGGYVQRMGANAMVLRIPASQFRTVAAAIGKLGRIDEESYEALDVTEDYYDLHTRIAVLQKTQTQLMTLLGQARSVKDALEVRAALDEVTLELESALGRQRVLASQVRFSALSLTLGQRAPKSAKRPTNDPFPWVDDIGVEGTAWR